MQLAIGGHLKQSKWVDRATSMQREALRVRATSQRAHALCESCFCCSAARCEQDPSCTNMCLAIIDSVPQSWSTQVVADYLMIVDSNHGVLEASAASAAPVAGQAVAATPRRAPAARVPRASEAAQAALRLYSEGHSLPAIAQTLVRPCRACPCSAGHSLLLSVASRTLCCYIDYRCLSAIAVRTSC